MVMASALVQRIPKVCWAQIAGDLPEWCQPNYYQVLGIRCDFPAAEDGEELKRAYKRRSLQHHPDKPGGAEPTTLGL